MPVDDFYEWQNTPAGKQPFAILGADGLALAMAGPLGTPEGPGYRRCGADLHHHHNELCGAIHDRMPVILQRGKWATWLGKDEADPDELRWMTLRPYPAALMRVYPVDVRVGNMRNIDPALLEEISLAA